MYVRYAAGRAKAPDQRSSVFYDLDNFFRIAMSNPTPLFDDHKIREWYASGKYHKYIDPSVFDRWKNVKVIIRVLCKLGLYNLPFLPSDSSTVEEMFLSNRIGEIESLSPQYRYENGDRHIAELNEKYREILAEITSE